MRESIKYLIIVIGVAWVGAAVAAAGMIWLPDSGWSAFGYLWAAVSGYGVAVYRIAKS